MSLALPTVRLLIFFPSCDSADNQPGAPRHEDTDATQKCIYSGYVKKVFKTLTIVMLNGPVSAKENGTKILNLINLKD
jgi:hypothetical protein